MRTPALLHWTRSNSPYEMPTRKAVNINILVILRRMKTTSLVHKTDLFSPTGGQKNVLWSCERLRNNYRGGAYRRSAPHFYMRAHISTSLQLHAQINQTMYTEDSKLFAVYINFNAPLIVCCYNHLPHLLQTLVYGNSWYRSKYCWSDWSWVSWCVGGEEDGHRFHMWHSSRKPFVHLFIPVSYL